jgi:hypothetical protein
VDGQPACVDIGDTRRRLDPRRSRPGQGQLETRIDFEIEDGQVQVRIRTRDDDTDERTERFEYFPLP